MAGTPTGRRFSMPVRGVAAAPGPLSGAMGLTVSVWGGAASLLGCGLAGRSVAGWEDLAPVSEPATPAPAVPAADPGGAFTQAFFLELGFSFVVGLAVGYALKTALKIALAIVGVVLIGIFGLQYAGLAQVDWSGLEIRYDTWAQWLAVNGRAFLQFVGQNLSETASFAAGLALGLKL